MPPLSLEGENLGQRHFNLNKLTNDAVQQKTPFDDIKKLPETSDVDRLYKIDVAVKYRNVEYILENLKSDDMLYVSRALKKSIWLVGPECSGIVNPEYFKSQLFPSMSSQAIGKTLLFVRLHLKNEDRAQQFYKYLESEGKMKEAVKWLPICSLKFIEEKAVKVHEHITVDLYKRLCERSIEVLKVFSKGNNIYKFRGQLKIVMFLVNTHTEEYLKVYEDADVYDRPNFGPKVSAVILKKCPERVLEKLFIYIKRIDMNTLGKYLGKDKIKDFIIKLAKMTKLGSWFSYNNLKPLVQRLPKEGKFEFLKSVFVDKDAFDDDTEEEGDSAPLTKKMTTYSPECRIVMCSMPGKSVNISSVYQWYRLAPFGTAFADLKKFIRTESSPDERIAMLKVLIISAGKNNENINTLLQYFHQRHINEPPKFKVGFVGTLVSSTDTHKYDDETWKILDEVFYSLEVYADDESSLESRDAVECILVYNLLHDKPIPEVILKKFMNKFSTLNKLSRKLDDPSKEKVFKFLFGELQKKIDTKSLNNKEGFNELATLLYQLMDLLKDWKKKLVDFPYVMKLIKGLIETKAKNSWDSDLSAIYNKNKSWRRTLFEYSLILVQNNEVYMNTFKHNPALILQQRDKLEKVIRSNSFDLAKLLSKLRIYFHDTLGQEWVKFYEERLSVCRSEQAGYKAVTRGLCILMARDDFTKLMESYVPVNYKVKWSEEDPNLLNLRKYFAQQMYLVRPTVSVDTVLQFAKGDYLQYAVPSLMSVCHKKSKEECKKFLPSLLNDAVSLQKHGIRLAFAKMDANELTEIFMNIWGVTKNASIRAVIFILTFDLLCKEKIPVKVQNFWKLLKMFMEKLTPDENRTVYATLAKCDKVPSDVRAEYCMMSYKLIKSLPAKLNCDSLANGMIQTISTLMDTIDEEFVVEILLNHINEMFKKKTKPEESYQYKNDMRNLFTNYIICSPNEETQSKRYEKIIKPVTTSSISMWKEKYEKQYRIRDEFIEFVKTLSNTARTILDEKETKYVNPITVFENILSEVDKLPIEENYCFVAHIKLVIAYCEAYAKALPELKAAGDAQMETDSEQKEEKDLYSKLVSKTIAPVFADKCLNLLKEDVAKYFPSIRALFCEVLNDYIGNNSNPGGMLFKALTLEAFVADAFNIPANLLAVNLLPTYVNYCSDEEKAIFNKVRERLASNENREAKMYYHGIVTCGEYE